MPSKSTSLASSRQALIDIEESHDYFDGSQASLEALRLEIVGLRTIYPEVSPQRIMERYVFAKKRHGSNAYNLIVRREWDDVMAIQHRMRLVNLISIYEAWSQAVVVEMQVPKRKANQVIKVLHGLDPDSTLPSVLGASTGAMSVVEQACLAHPYSKPKHIGKFGVCFRAFKEVRNSFAHRGNVASHLTEQAWLAYQAEADQWTALNRVPPELPKVVKGRPISVSGDGVVQFARVLQMMVVTFDAQLASTSPAFPALLRRWHERYGSRVLLSANRDKARKSFAHRLQRLGLPQVADIQPLFDEFRSRGLIF